MKYRSKRVKILAENCLSGVLTCDKDGNIFKKGKKANEHIDYDGYRAIYVDGVQIPFMTQKLNEFFKKLKQKKITQEGNLPEFWDDDIDSNIDDEWFEKAKKINESKNS